MRSTRSTGATRATRAVRAVRSPGAGAGALLAVIAAAAGLPGGAAAQAYDELAPGVRAFVTVEGPHVVIRDVRLIDGTGAPARDGMTMELVDGRIARIAPASEVGPMPGAAEVDGRGMTLLPGGAGGALLDSMVRISEFLTIGGYHVDF